jgi:hypothetical protein
VHFAFAIGQGDLFHLRRDEFEVGRFLAHFNLVADQRDRIAFEGYEPFGLFHTVPPGVVYLISQHGAETQLRKSVNLRNSAR